MFALLAISVWPDGKFARATAAWTYLVEATRAPKVAQGLFYTQAKIDPLPAVGGNYEVAGSNDATQPLQRYENTSSRHTPSTKAQGTLRE
ncbi:hypothetical protein LTR56_026467 [Elasticomyces elasticus]|nr:hypothetical protein LTR56_026467 [Elasticomyces elasticus]KAK3626454.1 hypothetical protein LTR22_023148 [Elasticomyces elasticus]KAK5735695.1 hypothetical protein LTS12_026404 [Elasticomyces elasticus]